MSLKMGETRQFIVEYSEADLIANTVKYIPIPYSGWALHLRSVVGKAITTGGTITLATAKLSEANPPTTYTTIAGLTQTIANSAAVGKSQTTTSTLNDDSAQVAAGDVLRITPASFATAGKVSLVFSINSANNQP